MALPSYDVESLIANIKRRCAVPTSQITYTDQDFTDLANDELHDTVIPLMMSCREEYFVDYVDVQAGSDRTIDIPEQAVGEKLRSVFYLQQGSHLVLVNLPRIDLDTIGGYGFINVNTLAGFYIEGSKLKLYPDTSVPDNTTIRLYYYKRRLVLASPTQYGQVLSIDEMNNTIVLDYVPSTWVVGTQLNSVSNLPGFKITNEGATITALSAPTIELDSVEGIVVGDYVSEYGYSGVAQIPVEAQAYLAQITASKCLEGLGDDAGMKRADKKAEEMKTSLLVVVSNRVDGSPKKIMNPSGLRAQNGYRRGGW